MYRVDRACDTGVDLSRCKVIHLNLYFGALGRPIFSFFAFLGGVLIAARESLELLFLLLFCLL